MKKIKFSKMLVNLREMNRTTSILVLVFINILYCYTVKCAITSVERNITNSTDTREARWFPFYTIGRFQNAPCTGINDLLGTCVLGGECSDAGGIATGNCTAITTQAVCCVYQSSCSSSTSDNNTYFVNPNYPSSWSGGSGCPITVNKYSRSICQLKVDFLSLSLAPPNGDGICNTDVLTITGGSSEVPNLCGENTGQHVFVNFNGDDSIQISITATSSYTFGRNWHIKIAQINCDSEFKGPSGCLQYWTQSSGVISSFNYSPSPNAKLNSVGVEGTRQLAGVNYGICIRAGAGQCSITYAPVSSDMYAFTMSGDVGAVDPTLLGTSALQEQNCNNDFIIIPNPSQGGLLNTGSDRFCGLGLAATTSRVRPFVVYVVADSNETMDIGNRGFSLAYSQSTCPVLLKF